MTLSDVELYYTIEKAMWNINTTGIDWTWNYVLNNSKCQHWPVLNIAKWHCGLCFKLYIISIIELHVTPSSKLLSIATRWLVGSLTSTYLFIVVSLLTCLLLPLYCCRFAAGLKIYWGKSIPTGFEFEWAWFELKIKIKL